jgi:hypothetical protein
MTIPPIPPARSTRAAGTLLTAFVLLGVGAACSSSPPFVDGVDGGSDAAPRPDGSDAALARHDAGTHEAGPPDAETQDAGRTREAGLVDATSPTPDAGARCDAATPWTCTSDGNARAQCTAAGASVEQPCPNGCLREPTGQDAICMGTTSGWSCPGSYGTTPVDDGNYYLSEFGCWKDSSGVHTDPCDNCIPACLAKAQAAGVCDPAGDGPSCEEKVSWYVADGARFGCLQHLRVENPANGKKLIAMALDYGPGCSGENRVQHAVLDSSGLVNNYLFGSAQGASDRALVHVVEVDNSTPLGPLP